MWKRWSSEFRSSGGKVDYKVEATVGGMEERRRWISNVVETSVEFLGRVEREREREWIGQQVRVATPVPTCPGVPLNTSGRCTGVCIPVYRVN